MQERKQGQAGLHPPAAPMASAALWILSSWKDLILFVATPVLIIPVVMVVQSGLSVAQIGMFVAAFGAMGHHLPGMMRAYGDRELFARFKLRFTAVPLALLMVCVSFALWDLKSLSVIVLLWGAWHGLAQVYGMARIYDAKAGSFAPLTARLDWLMCIAWFATGLLYSPWRMGDLLDTYYQAGGPLLSASAMHAVKIGAAVLTAVITVAFFAHSLWRQRQGQPLNLIKLLLLATSFGFWWYAMAMVTNIVLSIALFEIFHDVQYLSIVWVYNRKRVDKGRSLSAFMRFLFRRSSAMIGLYVGLVFAYGYIALLPGMIDLETLQNALAGFVVFSTLLHFYFDGFIWKVRERSTRESLDLQGGQGDDKAAGGFPRWLVHALLWCLFIVPIWFLELSPWKSRTPILDQYRSLVEIVPDNNTLRNKLGTQLAAQGRHGEAISHFNQAIQINPEDIEVHYNLGLSYLILKQYPGAIDHFHRALRLDPDFALAYYHLGETYAAERRYEEAIAVLAKAAELDPDSEIGRSAQEIIPVLRTRLSSP